MKSKEIDVLLIEDSLVDQKAFQRFIEKNELGYNLHVAGSLKQGLSALDGKTFDVVLVDYDLGDGTALDVLDHCQSMPIIVITGMGDEETAVQAMKRGAFDYLIKDIHSNYLKVIPVTIESVIQRWEAAKLQNLLAHTVRSMSDAVFVTDGDGKISFVNSAFLASYGYRTDEILGKSDDCLWDSQADNLESLSFLNHRFNVEWKSQVTHLKKSGEKFPVLLSRSAIKNQGGIQYAVVTIAHDVSEDLAIGIHHEQLLTEIQEILGRFRRVKASLPLDYDSSSLEDLYLYWKKVVQFLEESSSGESTIDSTRENGQ